MIDFNILEPRKSKGDNEIEVEILTNTKTESLILGKGQDEIEADTITNYGLIDLGKGRDLVKAESLINNHTIAFGSGRDILDVLAGGFKGTGSVLMGTGNDTVLGHGTGSFDGGKGQSDTLLFGEGVYVIKNGVVTSNDVPMTINNFELAGGFGEQSPLFAIDNNEAQIITVDENGNAVLNTVPRVTNATEALAGTVIESGVALSNDGTAVVAVDGISTVSGQLSAEDVDAGAVLKWSIDHSASTTYGTISIDPDSGQWTYSLDNSFDATQALKDGESITETFTARVTDENGAFVDQTIEVKIQGTNDVPRVLDRPYADFLIAQQGTAVVIPEGVTSIGDFAFEGTQLTSVDLPSTLTSIGNRAFNRTQLTSVDLPSTLTSIGDGAFADTQLTSVDLPSTLTSFHRHCFLDVP